MARLVALLAGGAAIVGGCATYEPKPLVPEEELAALSRRDLAMFVIERRAPGDGSESRPAVFDIADGLDENELIAAALSLNPALKAKRLEIGEGQAVLFGTGLWPNPELGVGVRSGIGAPGYTIDADVLFALLRPAEREARRDVASADLDRLRAEVIADEWKTVGDVRRSLLAIRIRRQASTLLGEEARLRERVLELARRRLGLGEGTDLEIALAEVDVEEIRRDRRLADAQTESARRALNQTLGIPSASQLNLSDAATPLRFTIYDDLTDDEVRHRVLRGRFELRSAEAVYAKAEHELRLAVERQFPGFKLGPSYGREPEGGNYVGLGISIELPLFSRNEGEIAAADARRETARASYDALLHRLVSEALDAWAVLRRARAELEAQERTLTPLIERTRDLFERAFRSRDIGVFEWITLQQRLLKARYSYLQTLETYQQAVLDLEIATGLSLSASRPESRGR